MMDFWTAASLRGKQRMQGGRSHHSSALWLDVRSSVTVGVTQSVKSDTSQKNAVIAKAHLISLHIYVK